MWNPKGTSHTCRFLSSFQSIISCLHAFSVILTMSWNHLQQPFLVSGKARNHWKSNIDYNTADSWCNIYFIKYPCTRCNCKQDGHTVRKLYSILFPCGATPQECVGSFTVSSDWSNLHNRFLKYFKLVGSFLDYYWLSFLCYFEETLMPLINWN